MIKTIKKISVGAGATIAAFTNDFGALPIMAEYPELLANRNLDHQPAGIEMPFLINTVLNPISKTYLEKPQTNLLCILHGLSNGNQNKSRTEDISSSINSPSTCSD